MKCKSWSNKINNFVVRRLKSIRINNGTQDQQQQHSTIATAASTSSASTSSAAAILTTTVATAQQQQQQQHLANNTNTTNTTTTTASAAETATTVGGAASATTTSATMPAMPTEKTATAVSLNENNFTELKFKELATASATVVSAMATTATATMAAATATNHHQQQHHHHRLQSSVIGVQQQQTAARHSTCGCGAAATTTTTTTLLNDNNSSSTLNRNNNSNNRFMTNGHSSPLAAAVQHQQQTAQRSSNCCRSAQYQNGVGSASAAAAAAQQRLTVGDATTNNRAAATANGGTTTAAAVAPITPPKKSPKDFIFGRYIGEGSFSIVYLAVDVVTKREYAIKVCEKQHILREHKQEYIRREREVMHMMTNVPGFVNLSCTFQDNRSLYFVMTYAKNGDMLPCINKVGSFDVDCTRHYAAELVLACEQMHRRNVVHRDLKPENILLDEDMHTLIADFGSAKIMTDEERAHAAWSMSKAAANKRRQQTSRSSDEDDEDEEDNDDDDDDDDDDNDEYEDVEDTTDTAGSDDVDSPNQRRSAQQQKQQQQQQQRPRQRYHRKRKGSFVGTAQYVSPEVLQNAPITPAADLWALGCIVYQMISGLPPFRGSNDYVIFKEILACNVDFPQGFDKDAEDLVRQLLKINPEERLGAQDEFGSYESIRAHPFFTGVDFDNVRQQTPPPIYPYLPGVSKDQDFRSHYRVPDNLEPGLDDKQLSRLLGMELGCGSGGAMQEIEKKTVAKNSFDLSDAEKHKRLEQQKSDKWHCFADNEVILKKGYVNKRKGLFARKRMLLLTTGPRLIYIDPAQMIKKGEIPWSPELRVEAKNFKIFFVHTPNRTYYLDDPEGFALEWVDAIDKMRMLTYKDQANTTTAGDLASTTTTSSSVTHLSTSPTTSAASSSVSATSFSSSAAYYIATNGGTTVTATTTTTMVAKKSPSTTSAFKTASN